MKRFILTTLLFAILTNLWGQVKGHFLEDGKEWKIAVRTPKQATFSEEGLYKTLRVKGDTIIGKHLCKNIVNETDETLYCTMYEEDGRVYNVEKGKVDGLLVFDFTLKEGESTKVGLNIPERSNGWAEVTAIKGHIFHERGRDFPCIKVVLKSSSEEFINERLSERGDDVFCNWILGVGDAYTGIVNPDNWILQNTGGMDYTLIECRVGDNILFTRDHSWEGLLPINETPTVRPIVEEGKTWITRHSTVNNEPNPDAPYSYHTINLQGDTLVGFHLCKTLREETKEMGYLYQIGDHVYYIFDGSQGDGELLYDFGMRKGETADIFVPYTKETVAITYDEDYSLVVNGTNYSCRRMKTPILEESYRVGTWIPGIGDLNGPLGTYFWAINTSEEYSELMECRVGTEVLYNHPTLSVSSPAISQSSPNVFDLQGRRLAAPPARGVFIKNGKTVIR